MHIILEVIVPWWIPVIGSVFAIAVAKHAFGGLGHNPFNPALIGRAFLMASWPTIMTSGWSPAFAKTVNSSINGISSVAVNNFSTISAKASSLVTTATPLKVAQMLRDSSFVNSLMATPEQGKELAGNIFSNMINPQALEALFLGQRGGCFRRGISN